MTPDAECAVPLDPETMLVMGHNMPDGYLFHEEPIPPPVFGAWPWPYQYRQWARAHRFVHASSRADLEAILYSLPAGDRAKRDGGLQITGGPEEWRRYAPPDVVA